jgi:DNA-binding beta-propeller fold protein YncE
MLLPAGARLINRFFRLPPRVIGAALATIAILASAVVCLQAQAVRPQQTTESKARPGIEFELYKPVDLVATKGDVLYVSTFRDGSDVKRLDLKTGLMSVLTLDVPVDGISRLAIDADGSLLAGVNAECRIIRINPIDGVTTTEAGTNKNGIGEPGCGHEGDQGPALKASFEPNSLSMDMNGNLFILDKLEHGRVRRIDHKSGIITTVVQPSRLSYPESIAVCSSARLFVVQSMGGPDVLLSVNLSTGSVAPLGPGSFTGNKDLWKKSFQRRRLICDQSGNLYVSDEAHVYHINFQTHTVSIVAGTTLGFSGDGGPATKAQFYMPSGLTLDSAGNLYIADTENERVRRVDAKTHIITTIAGNGKPLHIPGELF